MNEFKYTPDDDIKIERESAVRQLCFWLRGHEQGIPEWIKNSSDAYERQNRIEAERVSIVIFNHGKKHNISSISCLDLVGMTVDQIEKFFRNWADPNASSQHTSDFIGQGGHGQGGKCYMTQMFSDHSSLYTVKNYVGNYYGVKGGKVTFGYIPDKEIGRTFKVSDIHKELEKVLAPINCSIDKMPEAFKRALANSDGFTLVSGYGPQGYGNRIPYKSLINNLSQHSEMLYNLEYCKVYVISNGKLLNGRRPLALPEIEPKEGGEKQRKYEIPSKLIDPLSQEMISTTNDGTLHIGELILYTSNKSMTYKLRSRHSIRYIAGDKGRIGYVPVNELNISSGYKSFIYGECHLESLENFKQLSRSKLAVAPLTRAVDKFISEKINDYAKEFEARDRRKYSEKEKNAVTNMNSKLNEWKNKFLKNVMGDLWGGRGDSEKTSQRPEPLPSGTVERMELNLTHNRAGREITLKPNLSFYDATGQHIKPAPYRWISDDPNVALATETTNLIETFSFGRTQIYAELLDKSIRSNKVELEVLHLINITLTPEEVELNVGGRAKIEAICELSDGRMIDDAYLDWTENDSKIVRVSSSGMVFGFSKGETEVIAWDASCEPSKPAKIKVSETTGSSKGDSKGKGFPNVLISGHFDRDPDTNEFREFSSDSGPICQELKDHNRNIWWINSASPLAEEFLEKYKPDSREWRIYHLDRYIDVIVQIIFTQDPDEKEKRSANQWVSDWMYQVSEIQTAIVLELDEFIEEGKLSI